MTFTDFEDMAAYFGNNFSNQYWDMGGGKTIGNRRNTYESYRKSYNPVAEHYYEVDTDFDKTGNNYNKFPHKFECGDLVVLDLSNDYYEEVRMLKHANHYNGEIAIIKKCLPLQNKYDDVKYQIDIRNYDDGISNIYTVSEGILTKLTKSSNADIVLETLATEVHTQSQVVDKMIDINNVCDELSNQSVLTTKNIELLTDRVNALESANNHLISGLDNDREFKKFRDNDLDDRFQDLERKNKKLSKLAKLAFLGRLLG